MKNPIFLQYIVLFPIEAWSHIKQHHQEEITQYIAYTMHTQLYMVSNLGVIYCLLSSYRDERRQYITRLINIYKSNCYISHTFIIFPYKLIIYIEISKFCCNLLCYFLLRQSCWNNLARQHHQEEITQYIAYTMPKQNLNSYNNKIMKNSIFLQYIVLFHIEAWNHVKQHHQEEITQYITYICQLYQIK